MYNSKPTDRFEDLEPQCFRNICYFTIFWGIYVTFKAPKRSDKRPQKGIIDWKFTNHVRSTTQSAFDHLLGLHWSLSRHFQWKSPYISHFWTKIGTLRAQSRVEILKIDQDVIDNTCITISNQRIGFICGLWTLSRRISVKFVIFPDFTPFMRPFRPQKGLIKGPKMEKSIESSRTTSFPHFKLVWMISLGSVGPWAAYFNEISYIFVIFGPDLGPTGPTFLKFDRNRSRGYRECLTFIGTYSEYI